MLKVDGYNVIIKGEFSEIMSDITFALDKVYENTWNTDREMAEEVKRSMLETLPRVLADCIDRIESGKSFWAEEEEDVK